MDTDEYAMAGTNSQDVHTLIEDVHVMCMASIEDVYMASIEDIHVTHLEPLPPH